MRKIITIALREYKAAVKTKSFIIGLLIVPILMGGSMAVFLLLKDKVDTDDKKFAIIDHSGLLKNALMESAMQYNTYGVTNEEGNKVRPAYILEFVIPDTVDPFEQKLELSNKVRNKDIYAFIEIGSDILHPNQDPENGQMKYYSEGAFMDESRYWFSNNINNYLREIRINELGLPADEISDLFIWSDMQSLGLIQVDKETGVVKDAEQSNELQSLLIPYFMVLLMFMMVMMGASPLLTAVMEEKMEKIAEVLLASVTPFQFMAGKVLGSISVSLTTAAIYIIGAVITAKQMNAGDMIPYELIPWFFIFLILLVIMMGSVFAALGSACNDNKDAQNTQFPAMLPIILPLFFMMPVLQNPVGSLAVGLSLFPPFTPILMLIRMASPVTIPAWQPIGGLALVVLFTAFSVWVAARIFRTNILMQGQKPTIANLVKYAIKG